MKWPEERRDEAGYPGQFRRTAHDFIARYWKEPWRKKAVSLVRKAMDQCIAVGRRTGEAPRPPSRKQLSVLAEAAGLFQVAAQLSKDDRYNGISLEGALLAEAAGSMFCTRPSIPRWKMVGQIIGDDPVARMVLISLVTERMAKRPELRDDIRAVARKLVHQSADETQSLYQQDIAVVKENA